jgi:predicted DNA-binding transcriptional regulator YafY
MRRADRLFQIIQILRLRPVTTAAHLAAELEVSERTIYRDIRDLLCSGVPIEGEAGVGYALRQGFDLPPLMFTEDEIESLVFGGQVVSGWADRELQRAARSALRKIETVLPEPLRTRLQNAAVFAHNFRRSAETSERLLLLRRAIGGRNKIRLAYARSDGTASERVVQPLCLTFMGENWLLAGWCELRGDFRSFRVDRIRRLESLPEQFEEQSGRRLEDFLALVRGGGE